MEHELVSRKAKTDSQILSIMDEIVTNNNITIYNGWSLIRRGCYPNYRNCYLRSRIQGAFTYDTLMQSTGLSKTEVFKFISEMLNMELIKPRKFARNINAKDSFLYAYEDANDALVQEALKKHLQIRKEKKLVKKTVE